MEMNMENVPPHIIARCLCEVFVDARESRKLTRKKIAAALGKHPPFVTNLEQEDRQILAIELWKFAAAYGLNVTEVIRRCERRSKRAAEEDGNGRRGA